MNFTKFDIVMTVTMALAVISMSFVMPALGLSSASTSENEIPDFNATADRFDIAGDFPSQPNTPATGSLSVQHQNGEGETDGVNVGAGTLAIVPENESNGTIANPYMVTILSGTGDDPDAVTLNETEVGETVTLESGLEEVDVTLDFVENRGEGNFSWGVTYQIIEEDDSEGSWLDRIPILGGILGGIGDLAGIVAWGMGVLYWFLITMFEIMVNLIFMLAETMLFMIETANWLITTYGEIVSSAGSWAAVFVAVPGLILFLELAKAVMIGISLMPTT